MEVNARRWSGFAALCLLSGSGWILSEFWSSPLPGLTRSALHNAILCLVFWLVSQRCKSSETSPIRWATIAVWGATLVAAPQVLFASAGGTVSGLTEVLIFSLVPAIVVVLIGQRTSFGAQESPLARLGPALAGVAGAALLLPFTLPSSTAGILWLLAMLIAAALAGFAAIKLHTLLAHAEIWRALSTICGVTAVFCLIFAPLNWTPLNAAPTDIATELAGCLFVDGPVLLLTAWLLRDMNPIAFSSRYLLVPLVTIVEGFLLVQPHLNWTAIGAILLAAGGLALLRSENAAQDPFSISNTNQP